MKNRNVTRFLAVAVSSLALAVSGCGGGGGGGGTTTDSGGGGGGGTTTISTKSQAQSAGASSTQGASVSANVGQTLSNVAAPVGKTGAPKYYSPIVGNDTKFNAMHAAQVRAMRLPANRMAAVLKKAKEAHKAGTIAIPSSSTPCTDGGSTDISGTVDTATFAYTMTMTFTKCRENEEQLDGTITASGAFSTTTADSFDMTIGNGDGAIGSGDFVVQEFKDNYTYLFAKYTADMKVLGSVTAGTTSSSFIMTANGLESYTDFINTYKMTFTNLKFTSTKNAAATSGTDVVDGAFKEEWTDAGVSKSASFTFTSFTVAWTKGTTTVAPIYNYYEYSVDGTMATAYTGFCADGNGTLIIKTVTPIRKNLTTDKTVAGKMTINTTTEIVFNADGTVTVTINGVAQPNVTLGEVESACKIQDFDQNTTSTTTTGTGTTTGSTMTITSKSTGISLNCFTDIHVNYYNTITPVAATAGTWYVDWHTQLIGLNASGHNDSTKTCTTPANTVFEEALDITGDGVCDVGLDINGAQMDSTSNGTEHFTALTLPVGYYVVSVNNWSCATDVTSDVTIQIGSSLYTGYKGTYSAAEADGLGATTGAWYRVADIVVNSSGTINVNAPDTTLNPSHKAYPGFNLSSPAQKSPRIQ